MRDAVLDDGDARLYLGDTVEVMREMAAAGVAFDAIVTDPPYEIGFMGKSWDQRGVAFDPETWRAALDVAKPGAHLVAFGGTRTFHRLTCAIEDAGWEVRDTLMWLYGCLTPDVEVLTEHGWKRGVDVVEGELVAQWDAADESISLAPVLRTYRAPYDGPMRVLRNHDTDQLLTPNHRVYHDEWKRRQRAGKRAGEWAGSWSAAEASALPVSGRVRLPLAGYASGEGIGGEDYAALLGWVWTEGSVDRAPSTGVRVYQSSSANPAKVAAIDALFGRLGMEPRRYERSRPYASLRSGVGTVESVEVCWFFTGDTAERVRADLPAKRPTVELLWRMTLAERVAFLDAAIAGDGSSCKRTGAQQFHAKYRADLDVFQVALALTGQRGRVTMRANREAGSVSVTPRATTELQTAKLRRPDEHYRGDVWCIGVPSGAFVARRDGLVFVTGNSGFPKSLDVSKAIDKAAGAEREVVGDKLDRPGYHLHPSERVSAAMGDGLASRTADQRMRSALVTAPATPEAAAWSGWGTAMKPAWEPIVLARKPLHGTVAANVLAHGTGALNIDACRIEASPEDVAVQRARTGGEMGALKGNTVYGDVVRNPAGNELGRWPANVLLDEAAAAILDAQTGDLHAQNPATRAPRGTGGMWNLAGNGVAFSDSGGASRFFYTSKAGSDERVMWDGSRNGHPTVKPTDLMRWLVRLVTPPGGIVLDPFVGSGSTCVAARAEGFRSVGIDAWDEAIGWASKRLAQQGLL